MNDWQRMRIAFGGALIEPRLADLVDMSAPSSPSPDLRRQRALVALHAAQLVHQSDNWRRGAPVAFMRWLADRGRIGEGGK